MTSGQADVAGWAAQTPTWLREADVALAASPQIAVCGNIRDLVPVPNPDFPQGPPLTPVTVAQAVEQMLVTAGHTNLVVFDRSGGGRAVLDGGGVATGLIGQAQSAAGDDAGPLAVLRELVRAVAQSPSPCCLIIEGASRLRVDPEAVEEPMHDLLVTAEAMMLGAPRNSVDGPHRSPLYNSVFWLLDREGDLPHWLVGSDLMRVVSVPMPSHGDRRRRIRALINSLPGIEPIPFTAPLDEATEEVVDRYASQTTGLSLRSIDEVNRLAIDRGITAQDIDDAIRTYRVGIPDNPWHEGDLKSKLKEATERLSASVFGQPAAIRKAADILIRSSMGLTGAQTTSSSNRPQGVLFFAGPTGVGKTELAKAMAELVFGLKDAFLRFDMSEFSSEHAEARLIGAPPGYIGHNAGGELTNAIRQQPFRLILFDEVEKAHPRILDKFLQILEDGRLTDGNGSTVHFSEALIVFTSNLGVYVTGPDGVRRPVVQRGAPYETVESTIRAAVQEHFTKEIGRPELLNRIGDNIVVFDFIADEIGARLVAKFVANIVDRVRESPGTELTVSDAALATLTQAACANLDFGGRGVGNVVESMLINPLARALFAYDQVPPAVVLEEFVNSDEGWSVVLR
ncbi:putative Clp family protein [Gordonia araii NBRC 100433]|uniref:Chaperone n=2 Tax=Gordonia TaxID=2053 RepID=A0A7M4BQ23_9ACTN|nr:MULTISPECIES: AAA family ATPase [Gordonia]NNG97433.1 ATP-dependent Clp protease ATP-binding subunit [Gordonia araii NBRC 100433]GAB08569.1 putative Clp family protein [Gordonia araii NBRC 100433]GED95984.1 chaperone [Gordonia crocea]